MASINLLPWREQLREEKKRLFLTSLTSVAVAAVLTWLITHMIYNRWIDDQDYRNNLLTQEIHQLDKQIAEIKGLKSLKEALMARMGIIQELQANRPRIVHLFDELAKVPPKGIYFNALGLQGNQITMDGFAVSNTNISQLMRNINQSKWLDSPVLMKIKTDAQQGQQMSEFSMQADLAPRQREKETENAT